MPQRFRPAPWVFCLGLLWSISPLHSAAQDWHNLELSESDTLYNKQGQIDHISDWKGNYYINYTYYETGDLKRVVYSRHTEDSIHDHIEEFHPNGQLWVVYNQVGRGKMITTMRPEGPYLGYNDEGKLVERLNYKQGKYHGENLYYYPSGVISARHVFDQDKLMEANYYDEAGVELDSGDLKEGNGTIVQYERGMMMSVCQVKEGKVKKCRCE